MPTFKLDIIIRTITQLLQHRHGLINITKHNPDGRVVEYVSVHPWLYRNISSRYAQRRPGFYACLHTARKTGRSPFLSEKEKKSDFGVTRYEFLRGAQIPLSALGRGNGSNVFDEYTDLDKRPRRFNYLWLNGSRETCLAAPWFYVHDT